MMYQIRFVHSSASYMRNDQRNCFLTHEYVYVCLNKQLKRGLYREGRMQIR